MVTVGPAVSLLLLEGKGLQWLTPCSMHNFESPNKVRFGAGGLLLLSVEEFCDLIGSELDEALTSDLSLDAKSMTSFLPFKTYGTPKSAVFCFFDGGKTGGLILVRCASLLAAGRAPPLDCKVGVVVWDCAFVLGRAVLIG